MAFASAPTSIITAVLGFSAAALLAPSPAQPQSFYPELMGQRFCELRRAGVSYDQAVRAAIAESWSHSRPAYYVTINGQRVSADAISAAMYAMTVCPQYAQRDHAI